MKQGVYIEFNTTYMMRGCDYLYSGGENDPIENSKLHAMEYLANVDGKCLPFVVECGMPAQDIDREVGFLEDKSKTYRRWDAKIVVTVKVFRNMREYNNYLTNEFIKGCGGGVYGK